MRSVNGRLNFFAVATWILVLAGLLLPSSAFAQSVCGPIDLVFAADTTGSMSGAEDNIKADLEKLLKTISSYSGGDYRLGLVEFGTEVTVRVDLAAGNTDAMSKALLALTATGGAGEPEASDETLNTIINGLKAADRPAGKQIGDFNGRFRSGAAKIIIIFTDARPAGFDDAYTEGVDDVNAHKYALQAKAKDIHINAIYVPTSTGDIADTVAKIMTDYATTSSGKYIKANADGTGTADAISTIITKCGGAVPGFSLTGDPVLPEGSELTWPEIGNRETANFLVNVAKSGRFNQDVLLTITDFPEGSTVTLDPTTIPAPGDGVAHLTFTAGDLTLPGDYYITVTGTSADGTITRGTTVKVTITCRPPFIYGLPENQPQSQTVPIGGRATLTVNPTGSGLLYQWYTGARSSTFFPVDGATSQTLVTPPVNTTTDFWVRVSNACGTYDSFTATVTPSSTKSASPSRLRPIH